VIDYYIIIIVVVVVVVIDLAVVVVAVIVVVDFVVVVVVVVICPRHFSRLFYRCTATNKRSERVADLTADVRICQVQTDVD